MKCSLLARQFFIYSPDHPDVATWRMTAILLASAGEGGSFITPVWGVGTPTQKLPPTGYGFHLFKRDPSRYNSVRQQWGVDRTQSGHEIFFFLFEKEEPTEGEESIILWPAFLIAIHPFVPCHDKYRLTARRNSLIFAIQCCVFHFHETSTCITLQEISV